MTGSFSAQEDLTRFKFRGELKLIFYKIMVLYVEIQEIFKGVEYI